MTDVRSAGFALAVLLLCAPASAQSQPGWYPFRERELPWTFASSAKGLSADKSSFENGVWRIEATLKEGELKAAAGALVNAAAKSQFPIDLTSTPVVSYRMRFTQRDATGISWYFQPRLTLSEEGSGPVVICPGELPHGQPVGEWVSYTVNLNPPFLKFSRRRFTSIYWSLKCEARLVAGTRTVGVEVADFMIRPQTKEEKAAEESDPFLRQMRERKPLPAPHITDRFWMGLWGFPFNPLYGCPEVSGRDMLAHHVEILLNGGFAWRTCVHDAATAGTSALALYRERLGAGLDRQCRPFDIKVIPNIDFIAKDADTDPAGFKANLDGIMATFGKDPLIVGWDGAEETGMGRVREYLTAQWAIEDRSPYQPMVTFGGELNAVHKFVHACSAGGYPIGVERRRPLDLEASFRDVWRYEPPALWPMLQGSAYTDDKDMPTAAETRLMNHLSLAWGAGGIFYWRYGGVFPYGGPARDQSLADPFNNPSACWTEYGRNAPACIRIGATTHAMRLDEKAADELHKANASESPQLAYYVLRPRKVPVAAGRPGAVPARVDPSRPQKQPGPVVVLVINTDTAGARKTRPDLKSVLATMSALSQLYSFPGGERCPAVLGRVREGVELDPGGLAGWLIGTEEQARAANLAGDRALYLNSVRLPRYDIVFAKMWKADVTEAEALLARADAAFAADDYAAALDLQEKAEARVQQSLAAQKDYAAVTPILDETKVVLGRCLEQIRNARLEGRVKPTDPVARGKGFVPTLEGLGKRYHWLRARWVKGETDRLLADAERLRKEVAELQAVVNRQLGS
jgi:hypothetical protein